MSKKGQLIKEISDCLQNMQRHNEQTTIIDRAALQRIYNELAYQESDLAAFQRIIAKSPSWANDWYLDYHDNGIRELCLRQAGHEVSVFFDEQGRICG